LTQILRGYRKGMIRFTESLGIKRKILRKLKKKKLDIRWEIANIIIKAAYFGVSTVCP